LIFRFSLYGFLKNQRYFEPFFVLFCIEKGLNFTDIGLLVAFREFSIFLFEIPSGALADSVGRKKIMILSFLSYIVSFIIFFFSINLSSLFCAIFFFALGETFRTGTHKALIFAWLKQKNRENEKTSVYGVTRSWSKLGSAFSIPISAAIVYFTDNINACFAACLIPAMFNVINIATYPDSLDNDCKLKLFSIENIKNTAKKLFNSLKNSIQNKALKQILIESMNYEGLYKTTKDYIQPLIQSAAASIMVISDSNNLSNSALAFGCVFILLHLASALASSFAGKFEKLSGGPLSASKILWYLNGMMFFCFAFSIFYNYLIIQIIIFVVLAVLQNFWRPIIIARCSAQSNPAETATVLSIESQSKSFFTMIAAPPLGIIIDQVAKINPELRFLPLALFGIIIPAFVLLIFFNKNKFFLGTVH